MTWTPQIVKSSMFEGLSLLNRKRNDGYANLFQIFFDNTSYIEELITVFLLCTRVTINNSVTPTYTSCKEVLLKSVTAHSRHNGHLYSGHSAYNGHFSSQTTFHRQMSVKIRNYRKIKFKLFKFTYSVAFFIMIVMLLKCLPCNWSYQYD